MNFKVWFFKILKNIFINCYCKLQQQLIQNVFFEIEDVFESQVSEEVGRILSFEEEVFVDVFDEYVQKVLDEFFEDYCMVIMFVDIEGFVYKEIVLILEIFVGMVMSCFYCGCCFFESVMFKYVCEYGYFGVEEFFVKMWSCKCVIF